MKRILPYLLFAIALGVAACGPQAKATNTGAEGADSAAAGESQFFSASKIIWNTDFTGALAAAKASGRKIFLLVGRDACSNCRQVKNRLAELTTPAIRTTLLENYVVVYCDCDSERWYAKYAGGLGRYTLPLLLWIDPARPDTYLHRTTGLPTAAALHGNLVRYK